MKTRFKFRRSTATFLGALALGLAAACAPKAVAQVKPTHRPDVPNFDKRAAAELAPQVKAERGNARARLASQLPSVVVDEDPLLHSPKFIHARDGFLTGPNGRGRGVTAKAAQGIPANDTHLPLKAFLNEHSALFGHDSQVLNNARIKRDYVDAHNGLRTVVYQQELDNIPVFDGVLMGHITKNGELTSLASLFVPDAAPKADRGTPGRAALEKAPSVSAVQAIAAAAQNIGSPALQITPAENREIEGGYQVFKTPELAFVRQVWLPLNHQSLRLAWEVMVSDHTTKERFQLVVDAATGEVYLRKNLTCYLTDATYNVFTSDSPSPFTPSLQTPGTLQPPLVSRTLVTTPALDPIASPDGWIPDADNTTTGNNVDCFVDRDFDGQPDRPRPLGNPPRTFDFPMDLAVDDPTNYIDASTVQLFYRGNWYHDRLYQLGFTEAAGNFQRDNFGRGGLGSDNVIAYVQAGADLGVADNSMFGTGPDGVSGECYMFVFDFPTPWRDGALDSEVVMHEFTHGTSWRLVGGGMVLGSLQGDGMGEGWSDFYAMTLLTEPSDDPNAAYANGGYVTYRFYGMLQNYYFGIRHFPYSTDMTKNPFTFKDIDPAQISPHTGVPRSPIYPFDPREADEVHHSGEVWCSTLWEVRANLVTKYGWNIGNELTLQLVTDAMKLTPPYPNFLQARDAILLADRIDNSGANVSEIWRGFAKRGMGISATSPNGNTTAGVHEAFDMPGLLVDHVIVNAGNGNGVIDPNECDDLQIFLSNTAGYLASGVSVTLSSSTPGVIVVQNVAAYPPIPDGSTNQNQTPFRISIAPWFICGTPIDFTLDIKTDQDTTQTQFRLATGRPNLPSRFDSVTPVPIPDGDLNGTNSVIVVSNVTSAIMKATVSLFITHTYDQDLTIQLVSPDGVTNTLARHHGLNGHNYGLSCGDNLRTTFDDDATNSLNNFNPPYVGLFLPDSPLAVFEGKSGTNVNGAWLLHVVDDYGIDVGVIQCWSLFLTTVSCEEGPGECPGADLGVGLRVVPEPVILGNSLNYTVSITNNGPSQAKNVVVTHLLPSGAVFISSTPSQGTASQAGGVVTWNAGQMFAGTRATMTVTALPTLTGLANSSATVSSEQNDPKPANNSASVISHVNPPTTDLSVRLVADPAAVVLGGTVTYSVIASNSGPSSASGVAVTNRLPAEVAITSATVSQGLLTMLPSNVVVCSFGSMTNGGRATAFVSTTAVAEGQAIATASIVGNQFDPSGTNNNSTAIVNIGPAADMAIGIVDNPDPVLARSNLTYTISVTNLGPSLATGVIMNQTLPVGASLVSTNTSQGTISVAGNLLTTSIGTMLKGAVATVTVKVVSTNTGTLLTSANVSSALSDPNDANNSASTTTLVAPPFITIAAAGATLTSESVSPANGAIDLNETVTAVLRLRNTGNVATRTLMATLLATNGVVPVPPNNPQVYGTLAPSDFAVGLPFSFTASGANGGVITAVLQLTDGATNYPPVSFSFTLPNTLYFTNSASINIPEIGMADPYPSLIDVSGVTGTVSKVTATFQGFVHAYPHDVNALLVAPSAAESILMSHVANYSGSNVVDLTFDDTAASALPASGQLSSGSFQPAAYSPAASFPEPAPQGSYPVGMANFNSKDANGSWSLYIADDSASDAGAVAGGWYLGVTTITPVNRMADLQVAAVTPSSCVAGSNITATFTITNAGPDPATFVAFSNNLPAGVTLVSATVSQGTLLSSSGPVLATLGTVNTGATATVTVVMNVGANDNGTLVNAATVSASETDLNPLNNTVSKTTSVTLPVADIAVMETVNTNTVLIGSNLTFTAVITNVGPGIALEVGFTNALPAGLSFVSALSSQGSVAHVGGTVAGNLGNILPDSSVTVLLTLGTTATGTLTNSVAVSTIAFDGNLADNAASASATVLAPAPYIVVDSALVTTESSTPHNGAVDPGETVTVSIALKNIGSANTANCKATLLASGGVTPVGTTQKTYGALPMGGAAVANSFSFTAANSGSGVTATLQLQDGTADIGTVALAFSFPARASWTNSAAISIPDHGSAAPYPSTISVSGVTGLVARVSVSLNGVTHSFPRDLSALLVNPAGGKTLLLAHAGGAFGMTNVNLTFADTAVVSLPVTNQIVSGSFKPSAYGDTPAFPSPAPAAPYPVSLGALNGSTANGTWSLFVLDDSSGDAGSIAGGWSLTLDVVDTQNPVSDLALGLASRPESLFQGLSFTNTVTITNVGPAAATGVLVTNTFSPGVTLASSAAAQGTISTVAGGAVVWNVGNLAVGAGAKATLVLQAGDFGTVSSSSFAEGAEIDLNQVNNSAVATTLVSPLATPVLSGFVTNSHFQLSITAEPNFTYVILASTNLTSWVPVSTNVASPGGTIKFTDNSPLLQSRFYKAVPVLP